MKKFNTSHLQDMKLFKKVKNILSKKQAVGLGRRYLPVHCNC
jgi:hypothetical protein